jgi:hypothetical protein
MNASPDVTTVQAFLARAKRRHAWITRTAGVAPGLMAAIAISVVLAIVDKALGVLLHAAIAAVCVMASVLISSRGAGRTSLLIEARTPHSKNLVVTAEELIERRMRVNPAIGDRVLNRAAILTTSLDPATIFPARGTLSKVGVTLLVWMAAVAVLVVMPRQIQGYSTRAETGAAIQSVQVTITPPAYSGRTVHQMSDPTRIEALAGSRIAVLVRAAFDSVFLETIAGRQPLAPSAGEYRGALVADADGFIAIDAGTGGRRLIGLTVIPDRAPQVKAIAPGKDLLLPDANRSIDVTIEASDDLALSSLVLRYTKVSGSGEQFTFTEGEIPIALTRTDNRNWRANGRIQLAQLGLQAGDMVVYRGAARDRRPGAQAAESDAFIVEITAPGAVAAEGFAIDDERDRYALSQQMVIVKTQRLLARAPGMPADSLLRESMAIGAEQRSVRAEFVFMMGGELAEEVLEAAGLNELNEEAHVAADDEAIAGRLANQGRLALVLAIRSMSRASTALNTGDLANALTAERAALDQLQRAFSRTRYILRALTQRERLDLSRRLTGVLEGVARTNRPNLLPDDNPRLASLRRALAELASNSNTEAPADAMRLSRLAQTVLQVDPSSQPLQDIAAAIDAAARGINDGQRDRARQQLDQAATLLAASIRTELTEAPQQPGAGDKRLEGAWVDALRRSQR